MANNEKANDSSEQDSEKLLKANIELKELNGKTGSEKPALKRPGSHDVDLEQRFRDTPLTDDTSCGWGIFRSSFLQR